MLSDTNFNNFSINIVQALKDSNILLKGVTKTIKNETKEQKGGFLGMLLATLRPSLLESMVKGKRKLRAGYKNNERKGIVRAGYGCLIKKNFDSTTSFNKLWNTNNKTQ